MNRKKQLMRRLCVMILTLAMVVTMMPLTGAMAFAESDAKVDKAVLEAAEDAGIDPNDTESVQAVADGLQEAGIDLDSTEVEEPDIGTLTQYDGKIVDADKVPAEDLDEAPERKIKLNESEEIKYEDDNEYFTPVDPDEAEEIFVWDKKPCDIDSNYTTVTYKFTPENDGIFYFYSGNNSTDSMDPFGRVVVLDEESGLFKQLKSNDDDGGDGNFRIEFNGTKDTTYYLQAIQYNNNKAGSFKLYLDTYTEDYTASIKVTLNKKTGKATVRGTVEGDRFDALYVGSEESSVNIDCTTSFTKTINMKKYSVGLHTVYAVLKNHTEDSDRVKNKYAVPTYIYSKPANKKSYYYVGHNYLNYTYGGSGYKDCKLMLDYKQKGKKWKNGFGPVKAGSTKKVKKLKSGKKYTIRTYYYKKFKYNGKTYTYTGKKNTKKVSKNVTIKTGGKKLRIKSFKISKAREYSTRSPITIYIGGWAYTPIYYHTEFQVTVKLKKKPGAKGICVGTLMIPGNKKTYKATMTISGYHKGEKMKFSLCSYQNATYKGYSPIIHKNKKIK